MLIFVPQISAQSGDVKTTHILTSDSVDKGKPCCYYNLFPFFSDNRDTCILCAYNKYLNIYKYYKYVSSDKTLTLICTNNKLYEDGHADSLNNLMRDYFLYQRNSINAQDTPTESLFVSTINMSIDLLKQRISFSVNARNMVAYKDEITNCIMLWYPTYFTYVENSKDVDKFTWISDTTLLYSIPHLEDEHGTISYTLHVYDILHSQSFPVISDKLFNYFDYYDNEIFFMNADLQLCKAVLQKNENSYSLNAIEFLTANQLYNMEIYGLFKLPVKRQFIMIGNDDYYLFQLNCN